METTAIIGALPAAMPSFVDSVLRFPAAFSVGGRVSLMLPGTAPLSLPKDKAYIHLHNGDTHWTAGSDGFPKTPTPMSGVNNTFFTALIPVSVSQTVQVLTCALPCGAPEGHTHAVVLRTRTTSALGTSVTPFELYTGAVITEGGPADIPMLTFKRFTVAKDAKSEDARSSPSGSVHPAGTTSCAQTPAPSTASAPAPVPAPAPAPVTCNCESCRPTVAAQAAAAAYVLRDEAARAAVTIERLQSENLALRAAVHALSK